MSFECSAVARGGDLVLASWKGMMLSNSIDAVHWEVKDFTSGRTPTPPITGTIAPSKTFAELLADGIGLGSGVLPAHVTLGDLANESARLEWI